MAVALALAFAAGLITAVSPCVLPVLPIVLAGGASGGRRRPYAIIAGLSGCFLVSILFAVWILDELGLPQDLLRNISIGLLFLVAATLIIPRLGAALERPFARLARGPSSDLGGGFLLGCALGFVFVPCGGPAIGFVTSSAASLDFGVKTIAVAVAYTLGAGVVLLAIAIGGSRASAAVRAGVRRLHVAFGIVIAAAALALVFDVDTKLQTWLPGWTDVLQRHTEASAAGIKAYSRGSKTVSAPGLDDLGSAPEFREIQEWLNTPGGKPLTIEGLRGKVVLVDFWTYSCINCLRTLPHLKAWYRTYGRKGLVIVGVHTPEFAFEHVPSNVRGAVRRLGVRYPVALDNHYGTWNAYRNQYWPAEYLIDKRGRLRHAHFGEGRYGETERLIRALLSERRGAPVSARLSDPTPDHPMTPESYLGYSRLDRYAGSPLRPGREAEYSFPPALPPDHLAYAGRWRVEPERIVSGRGARLRLHFFAKNVFLVLGGKGRVQVLVDGRQLRAARVSGISRLYMLVRYPRERNGLLELRFPRGISTYAFTFG
jgi:cytochrome c biogenesis protein CcdA/thiol-disulfide isomerase/thioredoxin